MRSRQRCEGGQTDPSPVMEVDRHPGDNTHSRAPHLFPHTTHVDLAPLAAKSRKECTRDEASHFCGDATAVAHSVPKLVVRKVRKLRMWLAQPRSPCRTAGQLQLTFQRALVIGIQGSQHEQRQ